LIIFYQSKSIDCIQSINQNQSNIINQTQSIKFNQSLIDQDLLIQSINRSRLFETIKNPSIEDYKTKKSSL